ncbi:fibronectin type III domain-containing protein [Streptosporangium canum]|uniref:fibronectin type III domain-containing protein n=1 Tax=Streptosporangium canum TaxID=324952 RepID=UPI0033A212C6
MAVTETLMGLGSWQIMLAEETPRDLLDRLGFFGHVAVVPGRVNPAEYQDMLLDMARYVGVLTGREFEKAKKIGGQGMAVWLGDADDKGEVLESAVQIAGQTFPNAIRTLLGSSTAVVEGVLGSVPGTYSGRHQWQSRRKAISYVCDTMGGEWRVNGDGTLDAGLATSLFRSNPDCVIVRHGADGRDLALTGLPGDMSLARDVQDWTTRVVLLAEGEGDAVATGSADIGSNPYLDLRGQPVKRTRLISESTTSNGNAQSRAQLQLNRFSGTRNAMRLSTMDYDVRGSFQVGDWVWVYDPDAGLLDTNNEIVYRGQRFNPIKLRAVEASWPVAEGMTVAHRAQDGTWRDLTPYVRWEAGSTSIVVGELNRSLTNAGSEPVGPRPVPDTTVPGTVTWVLPFTSASYLDGLGTTRARILAGWELPLNEDGSTVLDGDHYEIRYGVSPATEWQMAYAPWGELQAIIDNLSPGATYDFQIRAVDLASNQGAWSVTESATASQDTIPPSTPAAPTVAGSPLAIQVVHTLGKVAGGIYNLELDLDHLEVHVGDTSGFTADETTLRGKIAAHAGMIHALIPAIGTVEVEETTTRWVRVIAVDQSGNRSDPSAAASATALLIDDAHISNLTVTKVSAGTISSNWIIGASIRTASTGERVELNSAGLGAWDASNLQTVGLQSNGIFYLRSDTSGARVDISSISGLQLFDSSGLQTVSLDPSGTFLLRSDAAGSRVQLDTSGLRIYSGSTQVVDLSSSGSFTLRSAASGARVQLDTAGLRAINAGGTTTVDIAASGSFTLRSATSGARIELDTAGLRAYNSSGGQTVQIAAASGDVDIVGRLTSTVNGSSARLVINPLLGADPEIRFYENATEYHYITSFVSGPDTLQIGSVVSSNRKYIVQLSPGDSNYIGIVNGSNGSITGMRFLADNRIYLEAAGASGPGNFFSWEAQGSAMFHTYWDGSSLHFVKNSSNSIVKTFIIDHPLDDDRYLVHATTESPHNGVEYWGEATLGEDGTAAVELPGYFEALTGYEGRAVLLSCRDDPDQVAATYPEGGRFTISGPAGRHVFWLVKAIRSDVPPLLVEPRRDEVTVRGDGPYRYYTPRDTNGS